MSIPNDTLVWKGVLKQHQDFIASLEQAGDAMAEDISNLLALLEQFGLSGKRDRSTAAALIRPVREHQSTWRKAKGGELCQNVTD